MIAALPALPFIRIIALSGCLVVFGPASAAAQSPAQCQAPAASPDERIAGCSAIIEAGQAKERALAVAYCNRGHAFTEKKELDRATADLNEAIRIDPKYACAYSNRGRVAALKG